MPACFTSVLGDDALNCSGALRTFSEESRTHQVRRQFPKSLQLPFSTRNGQSDRSKDSYIFGHQSKTIKQ